MVRKLIGSCIAIGVFFSLTLNASATPFSTTTVTNLPVNEIAKQVDPQDFHSERSTSPMLVSCGTSGCGLHHAIFQGYTDQDGYGVGQVISLGQTRDQSGTEQTIANEQMEVLFDQ
ncbi:MAG: hypothetical protein GFH27_549309n139 [Chloroflexi bacterium AL-W]|nr:hypothetical protein [Chloroflexi bacterium AL-N1]NOK69841.1 hypothetical protein [Chloroflexi bacterium AL-N10]NOK73555.1 hypothetical protein [Chloroflexi bacterium AL-N5]NOK84011.1 hypothetical protein [Chloroflexi bacterium AL-W]NOK87886.1 hypothetical protein [Chloroflexi bacterium AL-N15]